MAATSISRPSVGANAGHRARSVNRPSTGAIGTGNRVNSGNNNRVNTGDININVDQNWDNRRYGYGYGAVRPVQPIYNPVATGVVAGAVVGAAVGASVAGTTTYVLPAGCQPYPYAAYTYYYCGNVYYRPQYHGDTVVYVVVNKPG